MKRTGNVIWLNDPQEEGWELAIASVGYRTESVNEEDERVIEEGRLFKIRSHAVILIELPRRRKRAFTLGTTEYW